MYCYKCAGLHSGKDCNSDVNQCMNCMRQKKVLITLQMRGAVRFSKMNSLRSEIVLIMASRDTTGIKCSLLNIQSVMNKTHEIRDLTKEEGYDILMLTEK